MTKGKSGGAKKKHHKHKAATAAGGDHSAMLASAMTAGGDSSDSSGEEDDLPIDNNINNGEILRMDSADNEDDAVPKDGNNDGDSAPNNNDTKLTNSDQLFDYLCDILPKMYKWKEFASAFEVPVIVRHLMVVQDKYTLQEIMDCLNPTVGGDYNLLDMAEIHDSVPFQNFVRSEVALMERERTETQTLTKVKNDAKLMGLEQLGDILMSGVPLHDQKEISQKVDDLLAMKSDEPLAAPLHNLFQGDPKASEAAVKTALNSVFDRTPAGSAIKKNLDAATSKVFLQLCVIAEHPLSYLLFDKESFDDLMMIQAGKYLTTKFKEPIITNGHKTFQGLGGQDWKHFLQVYINAIRMMRFAPEFILQSVGFDAVLSFLEALPEKAATSPPRTFGDYFHLQCIANTAMQALGLARKIQAEVQRANPLGMKFFDLARKASHIAKVHGVTIAPNKIEEFGNVSWKGIKPLTKALQEGIEAVIVPCGRCWTTGNAMGLLENSTGSQLCADANLVFSFTDERGSYLLAIMPKHADQKKKQAQNAVGPDVTIRVNGKDFCRKLPLFRKLVKLISMDVWIGVSKGATQVKPAQGASRGETLRRWIVEQLSKADTNGKFKHLLGEQHVTMEAKWSDEIFKRNWAPNTTDLQIDGNTVEVTLVPYRITAPSTVMENFSKQDMLNLLHAPESTEIHGGLVYWAHERSNVSINKCCVSVSVDNLFELNKFATEKGATTIPTTAIKSEGRNWSYVSVQLIFPTAITPKMLESIQKLPKPVNRTQRHTFTGMPVAGALSTPWINGGANKPTPQENKKDPNEMDIAAKMLVRREAAGQETNPDMVIMFAPNIITAQKMMNFTSGSFAVEGWEQLPRSCYHDHGAASWIAVKEVEALKEIRECTLNSGLANDLGDGNIYHFIHPTCIPQEYLIRARG
ncbi:MAG: hypothetical protein COB65_01355 [Thalassobium sp.]|nr:MAG: hypothetical protein COB65_01355 [Thalassobium sp.]